MMKTVIALLALVAVAVAAPQNPESQAFILKDSRDNLGLDSYNYEYETSNGIAANEVGQLNNAGSEAEAIAVRGRYQYVGPDGVTYSVNYVADENGFQPQGAHIPV